jgi:hypothetical protein
MWQTDRLWFDVAIIMANFCGREHPVRPLRTASAALASAAEGGDRPGGDDPAVGDRRTRFGVRRARASTRRGGVGAPGVAAQARGQRLDGRAA